jgi:hypothetical protein
MFLFVLLDHGLTKLRGLKMIVHQQILLFQDSSISHPILLILTVTKYILNPWFEWIYANVRIIEVFYFMNYLNMLKNNPYVQHISKLFKPQVRDWRLVENKD